MLKVGLGEESFLDHGISLLAKLRDSDYESLFLFKIIIIIKSISLGKTIKGENSHFFLAGKPGIIKLWR